MDSGIECGLLGQPISFDNDDKLAFYSGLMCNNIEIFVGDCVQVEIVSDDDSQQDILASSTTVGQVPSSCAYGQILAIFASKDIVSSADLSQGEMVEIRWFHTAAELEDQFMGKRKRQRVLLEDFDIVESDIVDDVALETIRDRIQVSFTEQPTNPHSTELVFRCRFLKSTESDALLPVAGDRFLQRGFAMSSYAEYYKGYIGHGMFSTGSHSSSGQSIYSKAIQSLHISVVPNELPCREDHRRDIEEHIRQFISFKNSSSSIYISGLPGTGKTATVLSSINALKTEYAASQGSTPDFDFIEINCLRLQSPADAYTVFWRCISGQQLSSQAALKRLNIHFQSKALEETFSGGVNTSRFTVLLLDEIDFLVTGDSNVLYNFFDWPQQPSSRLTLIGISNIMDLPERFTTRVKSRIGSHLTRMIFAPYSHEQIRQILEHRLGELALPIFDPQLVEYLAKRIARAAGDLRAALKICQRTIQIFLEKETRNRITHSKGVSSSKSSSDTGEHGRISKEYVLAAINEYNQDPFKVFIRGACQLDKALIVCACQEMKALGQYELTFAVLWDRLKSFLAGVCLQKQVSGAHRIDNDPFVESIEDITLLLPPYELFEIAVHRLIHVGIFQQQHSRYSLVIPRSMIFSLHREIEPSVITAALKDTAFEKFI